MKVEIVTDEPVDLFWVLRNDPYVWSLLGGLVCSLFMFVHMTCRRRSLDTRKTV